MTTMEAILILDNTSCTTQKAKQAIALAIKALEKQIPKKVVKYKRIGDVLIGGYCPVCNAELHINNRPCYCGQVLNWE